MAKLELSPLTGIPEPVSHLEGRRRPATSAATGTGSRTARRAFGRASGPGFHCRSPRCPCRAGKPARRRPGRVVRPRDWAGRIMAAVDVRPDTANALAGRLVGARHDPNFWSALDALQHDGMLGDAALFPGQRIARLERRWPPLKRRVRATPALAAEQRTSMTDRVEPVISPDQKLSDHRSMPDVET